ncbi:hypothetical protein A5622_02165 [Mycobacterium sp. 1245801.1]|nr:hypothetical protein A5622_03720 [Mycobacterium sp. 1245801.1]OBJ17699.1 hypothetical protein A5622_02165 [Mycobacterium sp. 1245801.1]
MPTNDRHGDLTLPELIRSLKGDRTYKDLEAASGGTIKAQRWNQFANGERLNEFPEPRTLEAMADTLPCDIEVVILACARSVGIDVHRRQSRFVDMLPPSVDELSERSKSALLNMARTLSDAEQGSYESDKRTLDEVKKKPKPRPRKGIPPLS